MESARTLLQRLGGQVQRDGFAFTDGGLVDPILETFDGLGDWAEFAASWEDLGFDRYLAATGRRRRRRHAVFTFDASRTTQPGTGLQRLAHQPHFQTLTHNPLQGDLERWFEPMTEEATGSRSFHSLVLFGLGVFGELVGGASFNWRIESHQFRIEAHPEHAGEPTPEGMHRDGVDYVLVVLVDRRNIESGTTSIHTPDGAELGSFTLTRPRDVALVDDNRVFHGVTAVAPQDPGTIAHRDVLVLTYQRQS